MLTRHQARTHEVTPITTPGCNSATTVASASGALRIGNSSALFRDQGATSAVRRPNDWALVAAAYIFLTVAKLPPWLVVIGFALLAGLLTR